MIDKQAFNLALEEIDRTLVVLAADGYRGFDCSPQSLEKIENWGQQPDGFAETLEDIRADLGDCRRCRLARGRNNIVFGAGHSAAKLVFVGRGVLIDFTYGAVFLF